MHSRSRFINKNFVMASVAPEAAEIVSGLGTPALMTIASVGGAAIILIGVFGLLRHRASAMRRASPLPVEGVIFVDVSPAWPGMEILPTLAANLRTRGFHLALVSSGTRASFEKEIAAMPTLLECMDTVVTADECKQAKPSPEMVLTAARHLRCQPTRCLVFDADALGIEAAQSAGMLAAGLIGRRDRNLKQHLIPTVSEASRIAAIRPEWLLRSLDAFDAREIGVPSSIEADAALARPLPSFSPAAALKKCLGGMGSGSARYGRLPGVETLA